MCVQARAVQLEAELTHEKAEASKRELQLVAERDARGEPRHFEELKKFHDSYEQVRGSLDRCLELLKVRPEHPAASRCLRVAVSRLGVGQRGLRAGGWL